MPRGAKKTAAPEPEPEVVEEDFVVKPRYDLYAEWLASEEGGGWEDMDPATLQIAVMNYGRFQASETNKEFNARTKKENAEKRASSKAATSERTSKRSTKAAEPEDEDDSEEEAEVEEAPAPRRRGGRSTAKKTAPPQEEAVAAKTTRRSAGKQRATKAAEAPF